MSYNLSDNAFKVVEPFLNEIVELKAGEVWMKRFADNKKAAHLIRQGIKYCEVNPEKVGERFAELKNKIRISSDNEKVKAEFKFLELHMPIEVVGELTKEFPGIVSLPKLLEAVILNPNYNVWKFPTALLSSEESLKVAEWAGKTNKECIFEVPNGITIKAK